MTKVPANSGKHRDKDENERLAKLIVANTPTRVIGLKLGRSEDAVEGQAQKLGISLKPTNQSPYGTK